MNAECKSLCGVVGGARGGARNIGLVDQGATARARGRARMEGWTGEECMKQDYKHLILERDLS